MSDTAGEATPTQPVTSPHTQPFTPPLTQPLTPPLPQPLTPPPTQPLTPPPTRFVFVVGWLAVLALFLVVVAIWFGPAVPDRLISCVICATGYLVGIAVGIFLSPYNRDEKDAFEAYGKAISALITGWLLAKSDDLAKAIISPNLLHGSGLGALRLLLFVAGLMGAAVVVFYHRRYIADRSDLAKTV